MNLKRLSAAILAAVSVLSYFVTLIVRPVWSDIRNFLGLSSIPFMEIVTVLILSSLGWAINLLIKSDRSATESGKSARPVLPLILAFVWSGLIGYLIKELGHDMPMLVNIPLDALPLLFSFIGGAVIILSIMFFHGSGRSPLLGGFLLSLLAVGIMMSPYQPGAMKMTAEPRVFLTGEGGISIVWATSKPGTSYLEVGPDENPDRIIRPEKHGLMNWSPRIHKVSLSAEEAADVRYYRAVTRAVTRVFPTSALSGKTVSSPVMKFQELPEKGETSFIVLTDYHNKNRIRNALIDSAAGGEDYDLIAFTGDVVESFFSDRVFVQDVLDSGSVNPSIPIAYARGNHDTRGAYARDLAEWILPEQGKFYYMFTLGDLSIIVLDSGEDKPDDDPEYAGLVNFADYHKEQAQWLASAVQTPQWTNASRRIVLSHISYLNGSRQAMGDILSGAEVDLMMAGHEHSPKIIHENESNLSYPVILGGGSEKGNAGAIRVDWRNQKLSVEIRGLDGRIIDSWAD